MAQVVVFACLSACLLAFWSLSSSLSPSPPPSFAIYLSQIRLSHTTTLLLSIGLCVPCPGPFASLIALCTPLSLSRGTRTRHGVYPPAPFRPRGCARHQWGRSQPPTQVKDCSDQRAPGGAARPYLLAIRCCVGMTGRASYYFNVLALGGEGL